MKLELTLSKLILAATTKLFLLTGIPGEHCRKPTRASHLRLEREKKKQTRITELVVGTEEKKSTRINCRAVGRERDTTNTNNYFYDGWNGKESN